MWARLHRNLIGFAFSVSLGLLGCAEGALPSLAPVPPVEGEVGMLIQIPLTVKNAGGESLFVDFEGPPIEGLVRSAAIVEFEFRWVPADGHVGEHEFTFFLLNASGGELDRTTTTITVRGRGAAGAPTFEKPGAGAVFDPTECELLAEPGSCPEGTAPCVAFGIEVRDPDSPRVEIRARRPLPEGARLEPTSALTADFAWCPSQAQAEASTVTIELEADDGDNPPTPHDFSVFFRRETKPGCPGQEPTITITEPADAATLEGDPGYQVLVDVRDDMGPLLNPPLLHYSTTRPPMAEGELRLSDFEMTTVFRTTGETSFRTVVPRFELAAMETKEVFFVVSATDNDDPEGAECDHTAVSGLRTFTAVGGMPGGTAPTCDPCTGSAQCESGVCVQGAEGGRCLPACESTCAQGSCEGRTTVEGTSNVRACGDVAAVCGGGMEDCTDDRREPNDSIAAAVAAPTSFSDGQICAGNDDFFRVSLAANTKVVVTVDGFRQADGDLDLYLLDASSGQLDTSTSTGDTEQVEYCAERATTVYVRVFGYLDAENRYALRVATSPCGSTTTCTDDGGEQDDTVAAARSIASDGSFSGTICPDDDDFIKFSIPEPSTIIAELNFTHEDGDLDLDLKAADGTQLARAAGTSDTERIEHAVSESGVYVIRVFGYSSAEGTYTGRVTRRATE